MAVEAVIWDFGGVFTSSPFEAFERFEQARGLPARFIRQVNSTNPDANAWAQFERAELDTEAFSGKFLEETTALGYPVAGADVLASLAGAVRPAMVAALKTCKQHFKVGCITNNWAPAEGARGGAMAEIMPLFDAVIESAKVGMRKPEPGIYQLMCAPLGVAPTACVYLDDLGINCKGAALVGMRAIKVETVEQTLDALAQTTGLSFAHTAVA